MNYRHAYHAGNFADVLKHAVLALVIDHLKGKEAPFRVIDTHAGRGRYALTAKEAGKTGEWLKGIGRLLGPGAAPLPVEVDRILVPYLKAVLAENGPGPLTVYPGSPRIAQTQMRSQDVLVANELHPEERGELEAALGRDRRVKVMALDGWMAIKSLLPAKERRGVVLIDPPFEQDGELARLAEGLAEGLQRFATGIFVGWYPIKDLRPITRFRESLATMPRPLLNVELLTHRPRDAQRLNGCGLVIANQPFTLRSKLEAVLPELTKRMAHDSGAQYHIRDLTMSLQDRNKLPLAAKRRMRSER
ncbi:MAG TPA: 23S rRNA (adenine(2030)-N(6))-methyltransferase RlmJ [Hyphomicrobiaceae bacterium]|nr:23S rRNA (adenine(2030)-N(6))-methyltransferase RlmJ [Hyphomicrobiaceae bacterium]